MKPNAFGLSALIFIALTLPLRAEIPTPDVPTTAPATTQPAISVETHFSPKEEIAPTIVDLIDDAHESVDVAAFAFTHQDIAIALIRAHHRGVRVQLVIDGRNGYAKTSVTPDLIQAGITVRSSHKHGDQHSKYMIIDRNIIITGSFNFTVSADERNSENLLVIRNAPEVVKAFEEDYHALQADSVLKK